MRKQINGLALIVEQQMEASPFDSALFLFCNRERRETPLPLATRCGGGEAGD